MSSRAAGILTVTDDYARRGATDTAGDGTNEGWLLVAAGQMAAKCWNALLVSECGNKAACWYATPLRCCKAYRRQQMLCWYGIRLLQMLLSTMAAAAAEAKLKFKPD